MKRTLLVLLVLCLIPAWVFAAEEVTFMHYFSGTLAGGVDDLVSTFNAENPQYNLKDTPLDHEAFKTSIRVMLSGGNPPDLFSYWAGARIQFIVDADRLEPIDDVFEKNDLDSLFSEAVINGCTYDDGKKYSLPLTVHYAAFFYNKAVFEKAGVTPPKTWEEFLTVCEKLKAAGVVPIALGSRERWPAQFWLDYPLLRTAGPEYRAKLMAGEASYTDPEVVKAFELWKNLLDKGYFNENPNAYVWDEASVMVGTGEAAMTLMGTWFMQLDEQIGWKAGEDYDFFPFPVVDAGVADCAVGPMDAVVLAKEAAAKEAAKVVLAKLAEVGPQTAFNIGTGALAPNKNVPDTTYNALQLKVKALLATIPNWAFNYDLATPPPVADVGLDAFAKFVDSPGDYMKILEETEAGAKAAFEGL
jgi:multiple sugar transport system substrate-binding protein/raffinose/stachyose/melibiose transport system substrate-binding protein